MVLEENAKGVTGMLGPRIAALRKNAGLSQAELARRLHISASTVGMYEQGRREPPLDVLISMAGTLGVSIEYLLTGKTLPRAKKSARSPDGQDTQICQSLKKLSREELLVLLTAELFGNFT